jgi:hypothetical protein
MIGDHVSGGVTIEPLDEYLAGESVEADAWDAFRHVCGNVLMTSRLHVLGPIDVDTPGLPSTLMAMRARVIEMEDLAPRMKDASVRLSEIEARLFEMHGDLARAEVRGTGDRRTLSTMRELEQAQTDAAGISAEISEASGPVESYLRLAGARIAAAIGWSSDGSDVAVRPAALDSSELPDLTDAYNVLVQYRPDVEDLRRRFAQLRGLVQPLAEDAQNNQDLVPAMLEATRDLAATLQRLQNLLRPARYPFRRAGSVKSLGVSIIETVPDAEDIAGVLNAATHALQMADKTHMRLVAHLCRTVRQVESELLARSLAVDN